mmetsp:Transcript_605/g.1423  ORF Transcript_605/g.1423 Transcript_605/m.1423 type:complete len:243 (-) Transcript_605:543-1271(-)
MWHWGRHDGRHVREEVSLELAQGTCGLEQEEILREVSTDGHSMIWKSIIYKFPVKLWRREELNPRAEGALHAPAYCQWHAVLEQVAFVQEPLQPQKEALAALLQQLVVNGNQGALLATSDENVQLGIFVVLQILLNHSIHGSACRRVLGILLIAASNSAVCTPCACLRLITHMACLQNNEIVSMVSMWRVPLRCYYPAHKAVVEREDPKVLCKQQEGGSLALIGAQGPRRHDVVLSEAKRTH